MKIYMTIFDWSTRDDQELNIKVFETFEKALEHFKGIIADEKTIGISWVAEAFDENDNLKDGYELDEFIDESGEHDLWWNINPEGDLSMHDWLDLKEIEVN